MNLNFLEFVGAMASMAVGAALIVVMVEGLIRGWNSSFYIQELQKKMFDVESREACNKIRVESLENIVAGQATTIRELRARKR